MADKPEGSDDSWWSKLAGFAREVGSITDPEVLYGKMYNQHLSHVNDPQKAAQLAQRGTDLVTSSMGRNKAIWSGLGYMNPVTAPAMIVNQIQEAAGAETLEDAGKAGALAIAPNVAGKYVKAPTMGRGATSGAPPAAPGFADGGDVSKALSVIPPAPEADPVGMAKSVMAQPRPFPVKAPKEPEPAVQSVEPAQELEQPSEKKLNPVKYKSWNDVPTINPQDLVGKKVFPIFADLTKAGSAFEGIDSSRLKEPEQLYGGPGYPLLSKSQEHGLGWAVEGKGRGTSKLLKDADYVVVSAMEPFSHQSNASFANSLMKNMAAYVEDQRLPTENLAKINDMIRAPSAQKELQGLDKFPGFEHPDAEKFLRDMTFEQRIRVARVLESKAAQDLGAPNLAKITRATLDPEFAGVPSRHGMFLLEIPRTKKGEVDENELNNLLVHLKNAGLPEHPSYQYGIKGNIVGKFHHPVAPEVLFKDWFDKKREEESVAQKTAEEKNLPAPKTNIRRAFDLAMPVTTISQEVADMLPRHPRDIQSGKAAKLALNAFNDQWDTTETPVTKGGLSPAMLSQALKDSDASSTLSQYSPKELQDMAKSGQFTGYKLKDGEVYFGLKRGTNYADEYGFEHPDLTPDETALVSVVNNEPGAKGIGGAPVVLKAIQHGATALDAYAVPSEKHPNGFLPDFYSHFGFEELGRVPFDPKYVSKQQFEDMKHEWTKAGWNENMGPPSLVIMKWRGSDGDRQDAVRKFITQGSGGFGPRRDSEDVAAAAGATQPGAGSPVGAPQGERGLGDAGGDRGAVRTDRNARPSDRLARTLAALKELTPAELKHFGIDPAQLEQAKSLGLKDGGVANNQYADGGEIQRYIPHDDNRRTENLEKFHGKTPDAIKGGRWYHGTTKDFQKFRTGNTGAIYVSQDPNFANNFAADTDGKVNWDDPEFKKQLSDTISGANEVAGKPYIQPNVMPVHVRAENPFDFEDAAHVDAVLKKIDNSKLTENEVAKLPYYISRGDWEIIEHPTVQMAIKDMGHDSFFIKENGVKNLGVYDPSQLKSATGNQGTFNQFNSDINKADGGEVDRLKMSHKDVTQRIPQLTEAAQKLGTDEMTHEMYQELVNKHKPVHPWDHVPAPATYEEISGAVRENQRPAVGKGHLIPEGHPVGLRLDIPAYKDYGVWAPTIHDRSGEKSTVLAHEPVAHISNAEFRLPESKALKVAQGTSKSPFATIDGSWNPTQPNDIHAMAQEYLDHPEWSQVGMDPERHSYFYDRRTQEPITHADEVLQVGPLVLAKNAKSNLQKKDFKFQSGGDVEPFRPKRPARKRPNSSVVDKALMLVSRKA